MFSIVVLFKSYLTILVNLCKRTKLFKIDCFKLWVSDLFQKSRDPNKFIAKNRFYKIFKKLVKLILEI